MPNLDLTNDELAVLQNRLALAGEINPDTLNPEVVESLTQKVDNLAQEVRLNEVLDMDPEQLDAASLGLDVEAANLYGWGSPEHLDAIPEAARENPELPGIVFDVPESQPQNIQDALLRLSNMHSHLDIARDAANNEFVVVRTYEIDDNLRGPDDYNVRDTIEYSAPTLERLYEIIEKNAATRLTTAQIRQLGEAQVHTPQERTTTTFGPDPIPYIVTESEVRRAGFAHMEESRLDQLEQVREMIADPAWYGLESEKVEDLKRQATSLEQPIFIGTVDNTNVEKIAAEVSADRSILRDLYAWARDRFSTPHLDEETKRIGHPKLTP